MQQTEKPETRALQHQYEVHSAIGPQAKLLTTEIHQGKSGREQEEEQHTGTPQLRKERAAQGRA